VLRREWAGATIPRTVVIDTDGRALFQSVGFSDKEFREMVALISARVERRR
jgi:hypothetical protein